MNKFRRELATLINMHSMENGSDTPDFILATYLVNCLAAFDVAIESRTKWYGRPAPQETTGSNTETIPENIEGDGFEYTSP